MFFFVLFGKSFVFVIDVFVCSSSLADLFVLLKRLYLGILVVSMILSQCYGSKKQYYT